MTLQKFLTSCKFFKFVLFSILLSTLQSCLYISTGHDTNFSKSDLNPIKFESREAAELFFAKTKIVDVGKYRGSYMKQDTIIIPFIALSNHTVFYETQYYNAKIKEADFNADGVITLQEAKKLQYEKGALINCSADLILRNE